MSTPSIGQLELSLPIERAPAARSDAAGGFGEALEGALSALEKAQGAADAEAGRAALGQGNLHALSLALEKADVAMRTAVKVRNKVVEAYHEVMRMNV